MMSQACHGLPNHWQIHCLFISLFWLTVKKASMLNISTVCSKASSNNKVSIKAPHYWPFMRGIHLGPVDSSPNGFPSQRDSKAERVSMALCHHDSFSVGLWLWLFLYIELNGCTKIFASWNFSNVSSDRLVCLALGNGYWFLRHFIQMIYELVTQIS